MAESISVQELQKTLKEERNISILDVRRKSDYEASPQKIENGSWYDPEKIDEWINEIPKDREVIVYCVKGGSVSQSVADQLQKKQCNVKFIEGGIKAWNELEI
jgi:rhodanese-related sulfurtransferase